MLTLVSVFVILWTGFCRADTLSLVVNEEYAFPSWSEPAYWFNVTRNTGGVLPSEVAPGDDILLNSGSYLSLDDSRVARSVTAGSGSSFSLHGKVGEELLVTSGAFNVAQNTALFVECSISGQNGLTKNGEGSLTLLRPNNFVGTITLNSGSLTAYDSAALGGNAVIQNGGGFSTFGAMSSYVLNGGTISIDSNTKVSSGNFTLSSGVVSFRPVHSSAGVANGFDIAGSIRLNGDVVLFPAPLVSDPVQIGDVFYVFQNDGTDGLVGNGHFTTYTGTRLNQGDVFADVLGAKYRIDFFAGSGNDITLTVVPEPTSGFLMAAGAACVFSARRRRCAVLKEIRN